VADGKARLAGLAERELSAAQREGALQEQERQLAAAQAAAAERTAAVDDKQASLDTRLQRLMAEEEAVSEQKVCSRAPTHSARPARVPACRCGDQSARSALCAVCVCVWSSVRCIVCGVLRASSPRARRACVGSSVPKQQRLL
jgi:hypothetical protein